MDQRLREECRQELAQQEPEPADQAAEVVAGGGEDGVAATEPEVVAMTRWLVVGRLLGSVSRAHHFQDRSDQNQEIKSEVPVIDVPEVEIQPLFHQPDLGCSAATAV